MKCVSECVFIFIFFGLNFLVAYRFLKMYVLIKFQGGTIQSKCILLHLNA